MSSEASTDEAILTSSSSRSRRADALLEQAAVPGWAGDLYVVPHGPPADEMSAKRDEPRA